MSDIIERIFNATDETVRNQLIDNLITTHDLEHIAEEIKNSFRRIERASDYLEYKHKTMLLFSETLKNHRDMFVALMITYNKSISSACFMFMFLPNVVLATKAAHLSGLQGWFMHQLLDNHKFNVDMLPISEDSKAELQQYITERWGGTLTKGATKTHN